MDSKKNVLTIKNKVDNFPTLTTSMKQSGGDNLC